METANQTKSGVALETMGASFEMNPVRARVCFQFLVNFISWIFSLDGTGNGDSEGGNGSGSRGVGGSVGSGGDDDNAGGGSTGGSDHRAPGGRPSTTGTSALISLQFSDLTSTSRLL